MRPTFSGFYTARSGIQAARASLDITGQNLANMSTAGYTRQRLDATSIGGSAVGMQYANPGDLNIGQGVSMDRVSQVRDRFLDHSYRLTNADVGESTVVTDIKSNLEKIVNEIPNDSGLQAQINSLITALDSLNSNQGSKEYENQVMGNAKQIATTFNDYAKQLTTIRQNTTNEFESDSVETVNGLLKNIAALNNQIKDSNIAGVNALELEDQRNTMLDSLSQYFNIRIEHNSVSVGSNRTVSELSVYLEGDDGAEFELINNDAFGKFSVAKDGNGNTMEEPVVLQFTNADGKNTSVDGKEEFNNSQIQGGQFKAYLSMLNDNGEYDAAAVSKLQDDLGNSATRVTELLKTIQEANQKISDNDPDLTVYEKQRTQAIAELRTYMDVHVTNNAANDKLLDVSLYTSGKDISLVKGKETPATIAYDKTKSPASITVGGVALDETSLTGGSIKSDIYGINSGTTASNITAHGIGFYQKRLDTLASTFAETLNKINSTNEKDNTTDYNKPLYSNGSGSSSTRGITAANITVSYSWESMKDGIYITNSKDGGEVSNILYMKQQLQSDMSFKTPNGTPLFTGSLLKYATDMSTQLGQEVSSISSSQVTYSYNLSSIDRDRQSVSSVSIDDEGINLMAYGQALTASSRVMTTMDEALDVIINKMGRVGN